MPDALLILILPLLTGAALLLVAPAAMVPAMRPRSASLLLASLLLAFIASFLLIRLNSHSDVVTASKLIAASLAVLATGLVAAPLLDRVRSGGSVAAVVGGVLLVPAVLHGFIAHLPPLGGIAVLYAVLIAAVLLGLGGSLSLAMHPGRFTAEGARRFVPTTTSASALGWLGASAALLSFATLMLPFGSTLPLTPILACGLVGALPLVLRSRAEETLVSAAQGFTAGCLIALGGALTLEQSIPAGLAAALCILRSDTTTDALRLDDPQRLTGTVLLPATLGLLALGAADIARFADALLWLGASLALGVAFSCILWPLAKLTLGLALQSRD